MISTLKTVSRARGFKNYAEVGYLDAVFASTSPARWMDIARADAAVDAVRDLYGLVEKYRGLWIAGGWLGDLPYEESQRKGIVDRFVERGVKKERIIQVDGIDTVDKVRELVNLPEVTGKGVLYLGIASYPLHIARFNLAVEYAKRQWRLDRLLTVVGIPTNNRNRPFSDKKTRPLNDTIYGWLGLLKDARRLERHGFSDSIPGQDSRLADKIKKLNSELK